ncbi:MAG: hypothetical protein FJX46_12405, partial [Alphaproteobacteria bacterium]|nr:hypothetical protein [Alphaproteobacteria bacterium]
MRAWAMAGLCWLVSGSALADARLPEWAKTLDRLVATIESPAAGEDALAEARRELVAVRAEALALRRGEDARAGSMRRLLDLIGPPPDEKAPPELPDVAARRAAFEAQLRDIEATARQAGVIATVAEFMVGRADQLRRRRLYHDLTHPSASLYAEADWNRANAAIARSIAARAETPFEGRASDARVIGLLALVAALWFGARFLPEPEGGGIERRRYRLRLLTAVRVGLRHGGVAAIGLWVGAEIACRLLMPAA